MTARILVVDDIAANVKLLEAKLSAEYYDVITADNGRTAIEVAENQAPDIILLDVMMPGMDGFETCCELKANPKTAHIPVVMVTALSDVADRVRGLESGADDFLSKPVNDVALFARVRSLVRLKMMMDELRVRQETSGRLGAIASEFELADSPAKVLVVEKSRFTTQRLSDYLAEAEHEVVCADTGERALDLGREQQFDLVIVGIDLGGEDGLRLCSQFRSQEETRHLPLLLLLEDMDLPRLAKGLDLGVTDYLVKPLDRGELLARVRTQVRRRRYHDRLRERIQTSMSMAFTDSLTGLYNRRYLMTHLDRKLMGIAETGKPVSVMLFDVDHFKAVNDTHGHGVGDDVLVKLAEVASDNLRSVDLVARLGGEEFVVVMPESNAQTAMQVAERLCAQVAESSVPLPDGSPLSVTISIGVATSETADEMADDLLERADAALYGAKNAGRNRVQLADPPGAAADAPSAASGRY
jgi:two-component system cell cycle response regulator